MKHFIDNYATHLFENKKAKTNKFEEFAQNRFNGAEKVAKGAKASGGDSMLTYHHFIVKLPYYKKAIAGKFNESDAKRELKNLNAELAGLIKTFEAKDQIPFQKVMGKIEVLGELLINYVKLNG